MIEDAERAPEDCVKISANQHGCLWKKCDFIVSIDNLARRPLEREDKSTYLLRDFNTPIISPRRDLATYRMFKQPTSSSGVSAAWCAWVMGCAPILLAGMSLYKEGKKAVYWHNKEAKSSGVLIPITNHFNRWEMMVREAGMIQLRVMSGPLLERYPAYDPNEPPPAPPARELIEKAIGGVRVKVIAKEWKLPPDLYKRDQIVEVSDGEARSGFFQKVITRA